MPPFAYHKALQHWAKSLIYLTISCQLQETKNLLKLFTQKKKKRKKEFIEVFFFFFTNLFPFIYPNLYTESFSSFIQICIEKTELYTKQNNDINNNNNIGKIFLISYKLWYVYANFIS